MYLAHTLEPKHFGGRYLANILESLETPHLLLIKAPIVLIDHLKVLEKD